MGTPVWEFADRNHITLSVLMKHGGKPWFFRSRLADCFAILSFVRLRPSGDLWSGPAYAATETGAL